MIRTVKDLREALAGVPEHLPVRVVQPEREPSPFLLLGEVVDLSIYESEEDRSQMLGIRMLKDWFRTRKEKQIGGTKE